MFQNGWKKIGLAGQGAMEQIQSEETGPRILCEATMNTESPDEALTTPYGIVNERFSSLFSFFKDVMSHGIPPTFYHEVEKSCNTQRSQISRRNGRSQNGMDKVSARQARSLSCQWRSNDQEGSF